jgi:hypothetical protein
MSYSGCDESKNTIDSNNCTGQNGNSGPLHNIWSIFHVQKDFVWKDSSRYIGLTR